MVTLLLHMYYCT